VSELDYDHTHVLSDRLIFGKFFMIYSAIGLAVIGVGAGLAFRWKVLLPLIVLLPLAAVVFSVSSGFGYADSAIVIFVAEAILQCGYIIGLLISFFATSCLRPGGVLKVFKGQSDSPNRASAQQTVPPAGAGEAP
jgi:hypothetical protein